MEVLRRGGSSTVPTTPGGSILSAKAAGVDPPLAETAPIDACDFSTGPMNLDFELGSGPRNRELEKETCKTER
ncbi:UNVERIFIED_CONTAM: hypothetical protein Sradi_2099600 [Sesamum radiatum]|uniref:Uncharacterized protein n=1 Tax=Sesamum radiatum TaxID=300843 RepID=A0AAW2TJB9_SESRA